MAAATPTAARRTRPVWEFGRDKFLGIPREAHTYDGFLKWVMSDDFPEKLRVTYDSGWVGLDMSEEAIQSHAAVKIGIYRTLLPLVEGEDFGELYTDGVLLCNESADVSNNPDGVAARWETFEAGRLKFIVRDDQARALEGTPDWVMEIVSDSSVGKDTKRLREAYHRAKIPEYWLIDARKDDIVFQILSWRPSGYAAVASKDGWTFSKVFGRSFRLTRKKDRLGGWSYTLEVQRESGKSKSRS
jgi:Uma2 family endonuclease